MSSGRAASDRVATQVVLVAQEASATSPASSEESLRLSTILDVLRRRRRLALTVFAATLALGALVSAQQRLLSPVYGGSFLLLVSDPLISAERQSGGADQGQLRELALRAPGTTNVPDLIEVLRSPLLLQPIAAKLGVREVSIASALSISTASNKSEGVLNVALEWDDPRQGQKILKALSENYLAFSLRQRQEKLAQGLSFLDAQAPDLVRQVVDLQEQLSSFRRRNDFLEPLKQGEALQAQRQQLKSRLGELQQQEAQLMGRMAAVQAGKLFGPSSQGGGQELVNEVSLLEKQLAEAEASFVPDSPQVRSLRDRLNEVRPLFQKTQLDGIEAALAQNRREQAELERQERDLTRRFASNPGLVKQYDAIQQRLEVARSNLSSYISTRENFRLDEAQRTLPWRLISPPRFGDTPVKPNLIRNLLFTTLLGVMAGGGAALLRDQFDRRYHHSREVEEELGLPLLGEVPFLPEMAHSAPRAEETLCNLATNLELLAEGPKGTERRLILMASADTGEGRSMLVALLGQTLADQGQRVLLVDADLRNPTLHLLPGATNGRGLADLLADSESAPEEVIQPLSDTLHLLSAGSSPQEASKRLISEPCRRLLERLRQLPGYDKVLIDSPPSLNVGDALFLGKEVDGIIFVVSLEQVDRALPAQALERLRGSRAEVLGIVTNRPTSAGMK